MVFHVYAILISGQLSHLKFLLCSVNHTFFPFQKVLLHLLLLMKARVLIMELKNPSKIWMTEEVDRKFFFGEQL